MRFIGCCKIGRKEKKPPVIRQKKIIFDTTAIAQKTVVYQGMRKEYITDKTDKITMQDLLSRKSNSRRISGATFNGRTCRIFVWVLCVLTEGSCWKCILHCTWRRRRHLFCMQRIKRNQEYDTCRWSCRTSSLRPLLRRKGWNTSSRWRGDGGCIHTI